VVIPKTLDEIVATHRVCAGFGAPIVNRGGGTSLSGETVNYAVVIDNSKYPTLVGDIDVGRRLVTAEPGIINEQLNRTTGQRGLVFGPDPSSHSRCTIGGNVGNNSCGVHSVQAQLYGPGPRTSDNTHALEVVTYDGERFWVGNGEEDQLDAIVAAGGRKGELYARLRELRDRYAGAIRQGYPPVDRLARRVSGYNLDELLPEQGFNVARALVGTESTCVTVLQSTLMLIPAMLEQVTVVVHYDDIAAAGDHVTEIIDRFKPIGLEAIGLEAIDQQLIEDQRLSGQNIGDLTELPHPDHGAWLLVQFGTDDQQASLDAAGSFVSLLTDDQDYPPGEGRGRGHRLFRRRHAGRSARRRAPRVQPPDHRARPAVRDHFRGGRGQRLRLDLRRPYPRSPAVRRRGGHRGDLGWGVAQYPHLLPPSLTIRRAAPRRRACCPSWPSAATWSPWSAQAWCCCSRCTGGASCTRKTSVTSPRRTCRACKRPTPLTARRSAPRRGRTSACGRRPAAARTGHRDRGRPGWSRARPTAQPFIR
jgi:FAD/FMN-containing dehydrogenase